jgi:hypothetical protein
MPQKISGELRSRQLRAEARLRSLQSSLDAMFTIAVVASFSGDLAEPRSWRLPQRLPIAGSQ